MSTTLSRKEQQDLICRVTGSAPLGQMFRRYWWPALLVEEVAEPDGKPVRIRLLGQNFVCFRDSSGKVGIIDEACPHRLASLALGRNEDGGLRCIYHGWKFGVDGSCLDMPTEPEGYNFRERMRVQSYPVREAGGFVWTYLGPPELEPTFPNYEWTARPRNQIAITKLAQHTNYLQAVEGALDSAHTFILHRDSLNPQEIIARNALTTDFAPELKAADTCYGFRYTALRKLHGASAETRMTKMTRYVFPTTAITSRKTLSESPALWQIFVPVDDEHTIGYTIYYHFDHRPIDEAGLRSSTYLRPGIDLDEHYYSRSTLENWYQQDRAAMKNGNWTGINGFPVQDMACQETMGAITDHSKERLGTSDVAIIRLRRRVLESVRGFMEGQAPIGLAASFNYALLHPIEQVPIGPDRVWTDIQTFPGEYTEPELATR